MSRYFYNWPERLEAENYIEARANLVQEFSVNPNVISVFEYGSIGNPGISDLDLMLVVRDPVIDRSALSFRKELLDENTKLVIDYASIFVVPETNFSKIRIWDDINLQLVWGREFRFESFDRNLTTVARILDWLPERLFRVRDCVNANDLDVRKCLGLLKSSCYSILQAQRIIELSQDKLDLVAQVDTLRSSWFDNAEDIGRERLIALLNEALPILFETLTEIVDYVQSIGLFDPRIVGTNRLYIPRILDYRFVDECAQSDYYQNFVRNGVIDFPVSLSAFWLSYASLDGRISGALRECFANFLDPSLCVTPEMRRILRSRFSLCNQWSTFLSVSQIDAPLFKFGWLHSK